MQSFPMFIRTTGRRVVIAGGGEQAAQKARLLARTDARLVLAAPDLCPELAALVATGRAERHRGPVAPALFEGAAMVFVATGCPGLDAALHALARAAGAPVNVVDQPALCDLTTPSIVDRDPVVVAIGTEGTAPVLGRRIKTDIEALLPPDLGGLAALAGALRGTVARQVPRPARRAFWAWAFGGTPRALWRRGDRRGAEAALRAAAAAGGAPGEACGGRLVLVAAPAAADLLTLRAVQRLQEADLVLSEAGCAPGLLELARRDAERQTVPPGAAGRAATLAPLRAGLRVVRLLGPGAIAAGTAARLARAAAAEGLECEVLPGAGPRTGASAAGAGGLLGEARAALPAL
ncbi:precorrin-2 dehydrogenase/sirohydrochlorin ferrochelatase family protein [Roseivivax sp. CAU 1761]